MQIFTVHTEKDNAYVILPSGDKVYVPMDENAVHMHKNFNANSKIEDIAHDIALYLQLPIDNNLVKSILKTINSHK